MPLGRKASLPSVGFVASPLKVYTKRVVENVLKTHLSSASQAKGLNGLL